MDNKEESFILPCDCTQEALRLDYDKEDGLFYITLLVSYFSGNRQEMSFLERIKFAWKILRKKDHELYDIIIYKSSMKEFANWIEKMNML